jgi:hypothetical protein
MQHEPNPIPTPNPEALHAPSHPVCVCDKRTVGQLVDGPIVPIPMRITLRSAELFQ